MNKLMELIKDAETLGVDIETHLRSLASSVDGKIHLKDILTEVVAVAKAMSVVIGEFNPALGTEVAAMVDAVTAVLAVL